MVAPIVAAALKYGAGKLLENQGLPSGLVDPKGFILDKVKGAADTALDLPSGTTSAVTNPKAALVGAAKEYAKNELMDAVRGGGSKVNTDEETTSGSAAYKRGGKVKTTAKSTPNVSSASRRGDGIAQRGKTKGRYL
jgi:hypothetical protein